MIISSLPPTAGITRSSLFCMYTLVHSQKRQHGIAWHSIAKHDIACIYNSLLSLRQLRPCRMRECTHHTWQEESRLLPVLRKARQPAGGLWDTYTHIMCSHTATPSSSHCLHTVVPSQWAIHATKWGTASEWAGQHVIVSSSPAMCAPHPPAKASQHAWWLTWAVALPSPSHKWDTWYNASSIRSGAKKLVAYSSCPTSYTTEGGFILLASVWSWRPNMSKNTQHVTQSNNNTHSLHDASKRKQVMNIDWYLTPLAELIILKNRFCWNVTLWRPDFGCKE